MRNFKSKNKRKIIYYLWVMTTKRGKSFFPFRSSWITFSMMLQKQCHCFSAELLLSPLTQHVNTNLALSEGILPFFSPFIGKPFFYVKCFDVTRHFNENRNKFIEVFQGVLLKKRSIFHQELLKGHLHNSLLQASQMFSNVLEWTNFSRHFKWVSRAS